MFVLYDNLNMKKLTPKHQQIVRAEFLNVDREELRKGLNTTKGFIRQVVGGFIQISPVKAKQIERITKGRVRAYILRPDIFGDNGNE
jgi:deoxyribodipyrimidine photolyase-like uncharacterized protein